MFGKIISGFREKLMAGRDAVLGEINKVTKKDDLERVVGVYYMIGIADGDFDQSEKDSMMKAISTNPALSTFSDDDIMAAYKKIDDLYSLAVPMGNRKVCELLKGAHGTPFATDLMMFACVAGAADGDFDDDEKVAARAIAEALGEDPADFADFGL